MQAGDLHSRRGTARPGPVVDTLGEKVALADRSHHHPRRGILNGWTRGGPAAEDLGLSRPAVNRSTTMPVGLYFVVTTNNIDDHTLGTPQTTLEVRASAGDLLSLVC
jgi:hypothetical protein